MRRYLVTILVITALIVISGLTLGFQNIRLGGFERVSENPLGLKLGLDLQGGSHLVYQTSLEDALGERIQPTEEQMDSLRRIIDRRVNETGLGEPVIQLLGEDRLLVQLPGVSDPARAKTIIGETARLEFKHRQINVSVPVELKASSIMSIHIGEFPETVTDEAGEMLEITENPLADLPTSSTEMEQIVATSTADTLVTENNDEAIESQSKPDSSDNANFQEISFLVIELDDEAAETLDLVIERMIKSTLAYASGLKSQYTVNRLQVSVSGGNEVRTVELPLQLVARVPDTNMFAMALITGIGQPIAPSIDKTNALFGSEVEFELVEIIGAIDEDVGLTGDDLSRAYAGTHQTTGMPIVNIEFNAQGAKRFGELTRDLLNTEDRLAIFLDEEELIAPGVNQVITGGSAYIEGRDFTPDRARDISQLLEAGRLPIPIELIQERDVDAILGADSLKKSVLAGLIGLLLVIIFMTLYYRIPGLIAGVALILYASFVLTVFKLIPVTLTLSGVAAAILSVGMAVDANILIFERMKDELRSGRTLLTSINVGFNRAWPAIRDGNVSTLITCVILFWFADTLGASIVQGFAATLAIGVLISMFSAITISRTLLRLVATLAISRRTDWFVPVGKKFLPKSND
ncbi:MAG: protein translocase subunit SecD [Dehalococcoidia bacterium]|nr:protein translocase subunit SecD [Dehalococcoidia bacterium]